MIWARCVGSSSYEVLRMMKRGEGMVYYKVRGVLPEKHVRPNEGSHQSSAGEDQAVDDHFHRILLPIQPSNR